MTSLRDRVKKLERDVKYLDEYDNKRSAQILEHQESIKNIQEDLEGSFTFGACYDKGLKRRVCEIAKAQEKIELNISLIMDHLGIEFCDIEAHRIITEVEPDESS